MEINPTKCCSLFRCLSLNQFVLPITATNTRGLPSRTTRLAVSHSQSYTLQEKYRDFFHHIIQRAFV